MHTKTQTITQIGIFDANFEPIGAGTYLTSAAPGVKRCPKPSSIIDMTPVYTPSGGLVCTHGPSFVQTTRPLQNT